MTARKSKPITYQPSDGMENFAHGATQVTHSSKLPQWTLVLLTVLGLVGSTLGLSIPRNPVKAQQSAETTVFLPALMNGSYQPSTTGCGTSGGDWPMSAGNPQRTSWSDEEVCGNLDVVWYRPIEAYIPQNVQVIAANGLLYISTAQGLYALNAANGDTVWRFDTEMPLGNSPTVSSGVVYVGGYDRKLHALNAATGAHLWAFDQAGSGFDTNPLVVDGKVILGNRDGYMYAIGANGTTQQGQMLWRYKTGGSIHFSAAYQNGIVYFASDDNYAYALRADNGSLVWKSAKLPGDGYHSYWPVIYRDKVIFASSLGYRHGLEPGTQSVTNSTGARYGSYGEMQKADLFPGDPLNTVVGSQLPAQSWSNGYPVIDGSRITEYLEDNPNPDPYKHKPWRRTYIVLNQSDGHEFTFDSDGDGYPEYLPEAYWGTKSGNQYPPIVGPDNTLYFSNIYSYTGDAQGKVMGWEFGTQYMSVLGGQGAIAEPQAISGGGGLIYRSLCCDRFGDYFPIYQGSTHPRELWSYDLGQDHAPGYDEMWTIIPGWPRLWGWYKGLSDSINSAYHNHGDQNPLVPYQGRLYIHRSNAILAFGAATSPVKVPDLAKNTSVTDSMRTPSVADLQANLETEVQKILDAGDLRPGYFNNGQFNVYKELTDYFSNPGDTLYTLSMAYPYLSASTQNQLRTYLQNYFDEYFDPNMDATIGWASGAAREAMPLPPEVQDSLSEFNASPVSHGFSWPYPPMNFYAMWKYAQIVPGDAQTAYNLAKNKIQVPVPDLPLADFFEQRPFELNAYISGYIGFLNLQSQAGMAGQDSGLRTQVTNEMNRLLSLRWQIFSKDSYWTDAESGVHKFSYKKHLDLARNFMFMVPELADYFRQNIQNQVSAAIDEYEYIAPYWFVAKYESVIGEGVMSNLYNAPAMFQAKAYILQVPYQQLVKYLDVPAFARGDLFYIQDVVAAIEAGQTSSFQPDEPENQPFRRVRLYPLSQNTGLSTEPVFSRFS